MIVKRIEKKKQNKQRYRGSEIITRDDIKGRIRIGEIGIREK